MLEMQARSHRKAKELKDQPGNKSYIFNHPMLKCYHNRQALLKKNQITEDNYKQKVFLLHKWDFLKQIKATLIQEKQKKVQKRQAAETMVLLAKMAFFL